MIAIVSYTGFSISRYAVKFHNTPSDAAIVLGAAVWGDKPSPVFQARIDHGIHLHQTGKVKVLIFTGGVGKNQKFAESEVAKKYAIQQGVAHSQILIETQSKITSENLIEAKALLSQNNLKTVLLVSDPLHMRRAMTMADDLNINALSSPTPTSLYKSRRKKMSFLTREIFFYLGYLVFR